MTFDQPVGGVGTHLAYLAYLNDVIWRIPAESCTAQPIENSMFSWYNTNISSEVYHETDQRVQVSSISG